MRLSVLALGGVIVFLASCASSGYAVPREVAQPSADLHDAWGEDSPTAPLDDVTSGLANNASRGLLNELQEGVGVDADVSYKSGRQVDAAVPARERMLIYSGELQVEVPRAEDAGKAFLAKVESWGGYVQSQSGTSWTVRIPATRFDEAFEAVRTAGRVLAENRRANDVTEEFVDLGIRVDNARKSRGRLLEILEKAEKVEDILKIESELRRLTTEIERMEGRLKFLEDQVAMATLRAEFRSVRQAPPRKRQRRWSRFGWINKVGAAAVMEAF